MSNNAFAFHRDPRSSSSPSRSHDVHAVFIGCCNILLIEYLDTGDSGARVGRSAIADNDVRFPPPLGGILSVFRLDPRREEEEEDRRRAHR